MSNIEQGMSNDEVKMKRRTESVMPDHAAQKFDLQERLVDFAVRVITVVESLPDTHVGKHVAGQLVRAGTSPASNYGEAQSAESRRARANERPNAGVQRVDRYLREKHSDRREESVNVESSTSSFDIPCSSFDIRLGTPPVPL